MSPVDIYKSELKKCLPRSTKGSCKIRAHILAALEEYLAHTPNASYEQIVQEFGSPQNIGEDYLDSNPRQELSQKKHTYLLISLLLIGIFLTGFIVTVYHYQTHIPTYTIYESSISQE